MLCDKCKKNEATVHIKQVHNGKCETSNLCSECAAELEKEGMLGFGFNLADVLMSLEKFAGHPDPDAPESAAQDGENSAESTAAGLTCPTCHWTLEKLRSSGGKMGCPECYRVFAPLVDEVISHVHCGHQHVGKHPAVSDNSLLALRRELRECQLDIQQAIADENYEHAAVCRDRIIQLKAKLQELQSAAPASGE